MTAGNLSRTRDGEDLQIAAGRLTGSHGVRGEIKALPFFPDALAGLVGHTLLIKSDKDSSVTRKKIVSIRGGVKPIVKLEGIDSPEEAKLLCPAVALAPLKLMPPLPEGKYYYEQIVGLPVVNLQGELLGHLAGFFSAGEKDVWQIKTPDGGELLLPCIPETLIKVDLDKGEITMEPMEEF